MPFAPGSRQALLADLHHQGIALHQETWKNYMGGVKKPNAIIVQVDTDEQARQVILAVKRQNDAYKSTKITMRPAAGWWDGHRNLACCFPWKQVQETHYNESFSFSEGAVADIIVLFGKKFQHVRVIGKIDDAMGSDEHPIHRLSATAVDVTAGVQIATLADELQKQGLSLSTASMIPWVSAVGLAATGGHGTGRDEPAFSGLIRSMTICDMNGDIREITPEHPDFATLCSAHDGMLGIVLKMQLKTVRAFKLRETIHNYKHLGDLVKELPYLLHDNQYFTLMRIPTYPAPSEEHAEKWHVRLWNYTEEPRTQHSKAAPYAADASSLFNELSARVGDALEDYLMHPELQGLIPTFMLLTAAIVTSSRGTTPHVDYENHITHYQAAFPEKMRDVSYMIPVKDTEAHVVLGKIMAKIDELLRKAGEHHEYPATYAFYARYLKGTNGGLSTTATTGPEEHILALDMVTHPKALGIHAFEREFLAFLSAEGIKPRHHLGKNFPAGIVNYSDFLNPDALTDYRRAIIDWHGGKEGLDSSPFLTPYLQQMLFSSPTLYCSLDECVTAEPTHSTDACLAFLPRFMDAIDSMPIPANVHGIRAQLISQCSEKLHALQPKRQVTV